MFRAWDAPGGRDGSHTTRNGGQSILMASFIRAGYYKPTRDEVERDPAATSLQRSSEDGTGSTSAMQAAVYRREELRRQFIEGDDSMSGESDEGGKEGGARESNEKGSDVGVSGGDVGGHDGHMAQQASEFARKVRQAREQYKEEQALHDKEYRYASDGHQREENEHETASVGTREPMADLFGHAVAGNSVVAGLGGTTSSSGYGASVLQSLGWKVGEGLGKTGEGRLAPVLIQKNRKGHGIFVKNDNETLLAAQVAQKARGRDDHTAAAMAVSTVGASQALGFFESLAMSEQINANDETELAHVAQSAVKASVVRRRVWAKTPATEAGNDVEPRVATYDVVDETGQTLGTGHGFLSGGTGVGVGQGLVGVTLGVDGLVHALGALDAGAPQRLVSVLRELRTSRQRSERFTQREDAIKTQYEAFSAMGLSMKHVMEKLQAIRSTVTALTAGTASVNDARTVTRSSLDQWCSDISEVVASFCSLKQWCIHLSGQGASDAESKEEGGTVSLWDEYQLTSVMLQAVAPCVSRCLQWWDPLRTSLDDNSVGSDSSDAVYGWEPVVQLLKALAPALAVSLDTVVNGDDEAPVAHEDSDSADMLLMRCIYPKLLTAFSGSVTHVKNHNAVRDLMVHILQSPVVGASKHFRVCCWDSLLVPWLKRMLSEWGKCYQTARFLPSMLVHRWLLLIPEHHKQDMFATYRDVMGQVLSVCPLTLMHVVAEVWRWSRLFSADGMSSLVSIVQERIRRACSKIQVKSDVEQFVWLVVIWAPVLGVGWCRGAVANGCLSHMPNVFEHVSSRWLSIIAWCTSLVKQGAERLADYAVASGEAALGVAYQQDGMALCQALNTSVCPSGSSPCTTWSVGQRVGSIPTPKVGLAKRQMSPVASLLDATERWSLQDVVVAYLTNAGVAVIKCVAAAGSGNPSLHRTAGIPTRAVEYSVGAGSEYRVVVDGDIVLCMPSTEHGAAALQVPSERKYSIVPLATLLPILVKA